MYRFYINSKINNNDRTYSKLKKIKIIYKFAQGLADIIICHVYLLTKEIISVDSDSSKMVDRVS